MNIVQIEKAKMNELMGLYKANTAIQYSVLEGNVPVPEFVLDMKNSQTGIINKNTNEFYSACLQFQYDESGLYIDMVAKENGSFVPIREDLQYAHFRLCFDHSDEKDLGFRAYCKLPNSPDYIALSDIPKDVKLLTTAYNQSNAEVTMLVAWLQFCCIQEYLSSYQFGEKHNRLAGANKVQILQRPDDNKKLYSVVTFGKGRHAVTVEVDGDIRRTHTTITRKCECWFVRGHWRHYKDGKNVWVRAYDKGAKRTGSAEHATVYRILQEKGGEE